MIKCQVCGYENVEGDEYCEECGVKLDATAPAPAAPAATVAPSRGACKGCGAPMPPDSKFCSKCGARQDGDDATKPPSVAGKCGACGGPLEPDDAFCNECGARADKKAAPAKAEPKAEAPEGDEAEEESAAPASEEVIRLRVVAGKEKDRLFEINRGEVRIGRHPENDIVLESDGYVSGTHTRFLFENGEFYVEDLGSTNGTFIKIKKITKIAAGDEVKIGQSIFRLEG